MLSVLVTTTATLAVLTIPGLPVVLGLRLRRLLAVACLPPLSLALLAVSAELGHVLSIRWTPLTPLLLGLLLGGIAWAAQQVTSRRRHDLSRTAPTEPDDARGHHPADSGAVHRAQRGRARSREDTFLTPRGRSIAILTGMLLGSGLLLVQSLRIMGSIHAVNQTYDNVFHLNATRHILRSGDGSAWVVGGMTQLDGQEGYYPALWHQAASMVSMLSRQDIVLSSNVLMLAVVTLVWPLGVLALVRCTSAIGTVGSFLVGPLSAISAAFPLTLIGWGVVLPYLLALSMMPMVVLVAVQIARLVQSQEQRLSRAALAVLTPACLMAVTLAHPQSVFVGIVLCLPILLWATGAHLLDALRRRSWVGTDLVPSAALTVIAVVVTVLTWTRFRPVQSSAVWGPNASRVEALGQVTSLSPNAAPTWEPIGVLVIIAAFGVLLFSRSRWLLASFAAASALSMVSRSEPMGGLRYLLTGNWYSDPNRIAAIPIIVAVPLLAIGLDSLASRLTQRVPALGGVTGTAVVAGLGVLILLLSIVSPANRVGIGYQTKEWQTDELLSADERELLERLPEVVPADAVIATNAWNGSALAYAISDRAVLNTYMGFEAEPEVHLLNAKLDEANTDPEVCDAAEDLDVEFALDFGPEEIHGRSATYTGLNEISETGAAEVVLQVGDAKLLRILPCRGTDGQLND